MNDRQKQALDRLSQLLEKDLNDLKQLSFFKHQDRFFVFETYTIEPVGKNYRVHKHSCEIGIFDSLKSATSWCIADRYNQIKLGMEIKRLDQQKSLLRDDITVREALANRMQDTIRRDISNTKLTTKKTQLRAISEQLDKCINLAKYWQIRGFNNETARTGRPASNRTSR